MVDIGIFLGTEEIAQSARDAERKGFESVWAAGDHLAGRGPMLDPGIVLATAAAVTDRVRLGYGVLLAAVRPLPFLAKELVALQHVSGGRVGLAIGDGEGAWERWHGGVRDAPVWAATGIARAESAARTEHALRTLPDLLAGKATVVGPSPGDGAEITLAPAVPLPETLIAGDAEAHVLRRAVDFGASWFPAVISPARLTHGVRELRRLAEAAGRPTPRVTVAVPLLLDLPAAERRGARDRMTRTITDAYRVSPEEAAHIGVVGTPEQAAELLAPYIEAGADRIVLSGGSSHGWRTAHDLTARTADLLTA